MNWNNGFSARYYMQVVEPNTWRDIERYEITGGNISKSDKGLIEAADIAMTQIPGTGEAWIRIYLDARQEEDGAREAIFTGLLSAPSVKWDGRRKSYQTECYSVLKPADDVLLPKGWYAPAGSNGAKMAAELLRIGAAPVTFADNSPVLASDIIAEGSETNLSMAWKIINAIGWRIRIAGSGVIDICEYDTDPRITFDALENDCIELSVTDKKDWFNCPNVFRASSGGLTAVARDDDMNSPLSTVSRGREIWKEEDNCSLNKNEGIAEYALRRLREEQAPSRSVNYYRRFRPDLYIGDMIRLHHPAQGIDSAFRITNQKISLGYGGRTEEEAEEI